MKTTVKYTDDGVIIKGHMSDNFDIHTLEAIITELTAKVERKCHTRCVHPGAVAKGIADYWQNSTAVCHVWCGGGVGSSYNHPATTTIVQVWVLGKTTEISACRCDARHTKWAYSGAVMERLDEATGAMLHFNKITDTQLYDQIRAISEAHPFKTFRSGKGQYSNLLLTGDYGFVITEKNKSGYATKAERFGFRAGKLVKTGVALRPPQKQWEHGTSFAAIERELAHKAEIAKEEAHRRQVEARYKNKLDRAARLIARLAHKIQVTYNDARSIGYCEAGIRSWCKARGIDPNSTINLVDLVKDGDSRAVTLALRVARRYAAERFIPNNATV